MKTLLTLLASMTTFSPPAVAEESAVSTPERAAVVKVVHQFVDGMQAKDGARLQASCQTGAQFTSGRMTVEGFTVRQVSAETNAARLLESKDVLLERMWEPFVQMENRIAVVWTRYDFQVNGKMSHHGTDCFTLLKTDQGWKIVSLVYTVEPANQTERPSAPPR